MANFLVIYFSFSTYIFLVRNMDLLYYQYKNTISNIEALELYKKEILNDIRIDCKLDEENLTIEEKYIPYTFFECEVNNHGYFFKSDTKEINGYVDVKMSCPDLDFIKNGLLKDDLVLSDCGALTDEKKIEKNQKLFIKLLKEKLLKNILIKHNLVGVRHNIDISPLKDLKHYLLTVILERVFIFRYRNKMFRHDFISIISAVNKNVYLFNFPFSDDYNSFVHSYGRTIEYLPSEYRQLYFKRAYYVYVQMKKVLEYEDKRSIYKKIKKNISYTSSNIHDEYVDMGIYYFKNKAMLKYLKPKNNCIIEKLYYSFLTLKCDSDSGVFLYEFFVLQGNDRPYLRYLEISYHLGSIKAKKLLYEHYSNPLFYNDYFVKKYSW